MRDLSGTRWGWIGFAATCFLACTKSNPYWLGDGAVGTGSGTTSTSTSTATGALTVVTTSTSTGEATTDTTSAVTSTGTSEGSGTGGGVRPECGVIDEWTVAYYRFEETPGSTFSDDLELYDGAWELGSEPAQVVGPPGCGQAIDVNPAVAGVVLDDPAFDLDQGSVELWIQRPDNPGAGADGRRGVLMRDASNVGQGHFAMFLGAGEEADQQLTYGYLWVRLQSAEGTDAVRCSAAPLPEGLWVHVGVNFGPGGLELWVDGELQISDAMVNAGGPRGPCDGELESGISGSGNPWVVGAASHQSTTGTTDNIGEYFEGQIDELRISSVRRAFGG